MVAVSEKKPVVRSFVNAVGSKVVTFYSSTKDAAPPALQSGITSLENILTPIREPVLTTFKEHADPFLTIVDSKLAKQIEVSEEYLKYAQTQVVQPLVSTTEGAIGHAKEFVEKKSVETYEKILVNADKAIDFVLPPVDSLAKPQPVVEESPRSPRDDTVKLTKKVTTRLYKKAQDIYTYSSERAKQIVHIDLIAYAKSTVGADEEKCAKVFDKVMSLLPTPETTDKFFSKVIAKTPKQVQPLLTKGAKLVKPASTKLLTLTATFLLFVRSLVVAQKPAKETAEHQEQEQFTSLGKNTATAVADNDEEEKEHVVLTTQSPKVEATPTASHVEQLSSDPEVVEHETAEHVEESTKTSSTSSQKKKKSSSKSSKTEGQ